MIIDVPKTIILEVIGIPAPQGSKSAVMRGGKARVIEGSTPGMRERHKSWREGVAQASREWLRDYPNPPLDEPVGVNVTFHFPLPKSDQYRTRHRSQPDLDKLLRSTFDGLIYGALIKDDNLICAVRAEKRYTTERPGATIEIIPMGVWETNDREAKKAMAAEARKPLV